MGRAAAGGAGGERGGSRGSRGLAAGRWRGAPSATASASGGSDAGPAGAGALLELKCQDRRALAQGLLLGAAAADRGGAGGLRALAGPGRPPKAWERLERDLGRFGTAAFRCAASSAQRRIPAGAHPQCALGRGESGRRFWDGSLGHFVAELFDAVCSGSAAYTGGAPFQLSPWDLFHCHAVCVHGQEESGHHLALLFHAMEYPAYSDDFPVDLGFCQRGSPLAFRPEAMAFRNALFFADRLSLIDLSPGSPLAPDAGGGLVMEGLGLTQTVYEGDFGEPVGDIIYLPEPGGPHGADALYLCW